MERYAARLGSDCAFFISNTPSLATGRGEILNPIGLTLKGYTILLVKPDVAVSTAEAYASLTPKRPEIPLAEAIKRPVAEWKECLCQVSPVGRYQTETVLDGCCLCLNVGLRLYCLRHIPRAF